MSKKKPAEEAIVKQDPQNIVTYDYGDDAGAGYENQTSKDVSIPFFQLLQVNSPVVAKRQVPGAEAGMWLNSATKELYEQLPIVMATTQNAYAQFVPRSHGGGFVKQWAIDDPKIVKIVKEAKKFGKYKIDSEDGKRTGEDGDDLTETFYTFLCTYDLETGGVIGPGMIAWKSTMIKVYREIMTLLKQQTVMVNGSKQRLPLFAHKIILGSQGKENRHGYFYVPTYTPANGSVEKSFIGPSDERYIAARQLALSVNEGRAKVNYANQGGNEGTENNEDVF